MSLDRRLFLLFGAAGIAPFIASPVRSAGPTTLSALGLDAAHFGLVPGSPDDQSRALQRAIDEATRTHTPLALAPGVYRAGGLKLSDGAQLAGVRGATKLVLADGASLVSAEHADHVSLSGLLLDGGKRRLPEGRGLLHFENVRAMRITDCEIAGAGGNAVHCIASEGEVTGNAITDSGDAAIHCLDSLGFLIARNRITNAGDNGIQVWRGDAGDDGTIVADNRIDGIANRSGGSGQYGNAINVFRAGNVIVRSNRIMNCAFSAVRGNSASILHIEANAISNAREVALYSEFSFEGAVIANNSVDGAAIGVAVTNFNQGGRLAVVQGNLIRNLYGKRPAGTDPRDGAGIGIAVEADTAITGNTIENAPTFGIVLGYGQYLRDVAATGNVIRRTDIGIAVSVSRGAGTALITSNVISNISRGAIVGMDRERVATGDLMKGGAETYANLSLNGNRLS